MHFTKFGRYEIVRKLSRSLTDVYLCRDAQADRLVVLKLIERTSDGFTKIVIEAERRGALIQKDLHAIDRRILEVFEVGEEQNCFFVAMEYFKGRTLAEVLRDEGPLEPKRAARYAAEVLNQLRTLHAFKSSDNGKQGAVVHGDIKPSNIQISPADEIRLIDFGIAKIITLTHNLTHHNLGSPSYCSPERLRWNHVDANADLWALGVTLYEMVASVPPFQAESTRNLENLIQSRLPLRPVPGSCPAGLASIIAMSLAPDLDRRYKSAEAFEKDLRSFIERRATVAGTERKPFRSVSPTAHRSLFGSKTVLREAPKVAVPTRTKWKLPRLPQWRWPKRPNIPHLPMFRIVASLTAGLVVGLVVIIPSARAYRFWRDSSPLNASKDYAHASAASIAADWRLYQRLKKQDQFPTLFSPLRPIEGHLEREFVGAADNTLASYRNSTDGKVSDYDWTHAQLCLKHALELDPNDAKARGELALVNGYSNLKANPKLPKAMLSAISFKQAENYLPASPDPHLALARLYVYAYRNVAPAVAELHQAEQLGYHLGPRESELEADGYLYRAEWDLQRAKRTNASGDREKWLDQARDDLSRASELYRPIIGFSNVNESLDRVESFHAEEERLEAENLPSGNTRSFDASFPRRLIGSR
jgi:serine/threonine protein kinase